MRATQGRGNETESANGMTTLIQCPLAVRTNVRIEWPAQRRHREFAAPNRPSSLKRGNIANSRSLETGFSSAATGRPSSPIKRATIAAANVSVSQSAVTALAMIVVRKRASRSRSAA